MEKSWKNATVMRKMMAIKWRDGEQRNQWGAQWPGTSWTSTHLGETNSGFGSERKHVKATHRTWRKAAASPVPAMSGCNLAASLRKAGRTAAWPSWGFELGGWGGSRIMWNSTWMVHDSTAETCRGVVGCAGSHLFWSTWQAQNVEGVLRLGLQSQKPWQLWRSCVNPRTVKDFENTEGWTSDETTDSLHGSAWHILSYYWGTKSGHFLWQSFRTKLLVSVFICRKGKRPVTFPVRNFKWLCWHMLTLRWKCVGILGNAIKSSNPCSSAVLQPKFCALFMLLLRIMMGGTAVPGMWSW